MKKLGLFVCALAAMAMSFTACNDGNGGGGGGFDPSQIVDDGMYVIGEAVGVTDITKAANLLMAAGVNEKLMNDEQKTWEEAHRKGMYEKYLYLEANKKFMLVLLDGDKTTNFGGELEAKEIVTDMGSVEGYWCALKQNVDLVVPVTGLYHVVLDLNQNGGDLDGAGGAQIIVTPVNWGISGDMNGWTGPTLSTSKVEKDGVTTWTWENVEIAAGNKFKFKDEHGWKIWLDGETQQISAHSNLGAEMKNGGADIPVAEGGLYTIVLNFKLAKGDIANSYSLELRKEGELKLDPATFVVGISGTMNGWGDPAGATLAKYNAGKSVVTDPVTKVGTYVYNIAGLTFAADAEFKFRSNGGWLGFGEIEISGVTAAGEQGGNISGVDGCYDIEITLEWDGEKATSIKAAFAVGTPSEVEYKDITVTGLVPEGWTQCFIWAWNDEGNYTGGTWPGEELTIVDNKVSKSFTQVPVPINVIFSNGNGAQTNDIGGISGDIEIDIAANLK